MALPNYERPVIDAKTREDLQKPRPKYYAKQDAERERQKNWKQLSTAVTKRDGKHCRVCGAIHALDLHHLLMRSLGGKDELMNLAWICRDCHRAIHGHALKVRWTDDRNRAKTASFEWV
jgi:5-methylcytosine-specific restriction endonuclease McrA